MADRQLNRVHGFTNAIREDVYRHVYDNRDREVGGVLVGRPGKDDAIVVEGAIPALDAVERAAAVTFTHEAWEHVHSVLDTRFAGEQIVGWYHSHPGFGVFLSDADLFIHRSFFGSWWQFALVIDPLSGEEGAFAWRRGEIVEAHKAEVHDQAEPITTTPEGS